MKLLATSDTHGILHGIPTDCIDFVCFAGDIAPLSGRGKWHVYDQKKWMQKKFCKWAAENPNTEFVIIPGNHDFFLLGRERFGNECDWKIDWPDNVHVLVDSAVTLKGIKFYGTPWVPIISHSWAYEAESAFLAEKFSKIPDDVDVLLTHTPPHISNEVPIDVSTQWGGREAFGSHELANAVFEKHPRYHFCGHIHSGLHERVDFEKTAIYNVSRVDERYEVAYPLTLIDIFPVER